MPERSYSLPHKSSSLANTLNRVVLLLAFIATGVAIGSLFASAGSPLRDGLAGLTPAVLLWVFPLGYLSICLHEAGHLLAGRLVGFRFLLFVAGPLKISRANLGQAARVEIGLNLNPGLFGGLSASQPLDFQDLNRRFAWVAAGGPLASLGLGLLGLGGAAWLRESQLYLAFICGMAALVSLGIFCATLIPMQAAGYPTDGAQLLALRRGGEVGRLRALLIMLQASSTRGVRPRDLDEDLLAQAMACRSGSYLDVLPTIYAFYKALDAGQIPAAGAYLDAALSGSDLLPQGFRQALRLEAAYFTAFHRHEPITARRWLEDSRGNVAESQTRLRAEAAVLLAEGERAQAMDRAALGLRLASRSYDPDSARAEAEWIEQILARCTEPS